MSSWLLRKIIIFVSTPKSILGLDSYDNGALQIRCKAENFDYI